MIRKRFFHACLSIIFTFAALTIAVTFCTRSMADEIETRYEERASMAEGLEAAASQAVQAANDMPDAQDPDEGGTDAVLWYCTWQAREVEGLDSLRDAALACDSAIQTRAAAYQAELEEAAGEAAAEETAAEEAADAVSDEAAVEEAVETREAEVSVSAAQASSSGELAGVASEIASRPGMAGRLTIPSVGVDVAVFTASIYESAYQTQVVDNEDSASWMEYGVETLVGDHASQGFDKTKNAVPGSTMLYVNDGTKVTAYICIKKCNGTNTGQGVYDDTGICADQLNSGGLCLYTCNDETGYSVTLTFWQPV